MTTTNAPETAANPNGCDENHCLCPDGAEHCLMDNRPEIDLDTIIEKILCQLDQINKEIEDINNKLRSI
jgi:hypothetical protein